MHGMMGTQQSSVPGALCFCISHASALIYFSTKLELCQKMTAYIIINVIRFCILYNMKCSLHTSHCKFSGQFITIEAFPGVHYKHVYYYR